MDNRTLLLSIALSVTCVLDAAPKRYIAAGWDLGAISPEFLAENAEALAKLPVDGICMHVRSKYPDGREISPTNLMNGGAVPADAYSRHMPALRKIAALPNMRHSFIGFRMAPVSRLDWRDDAAWAAVAHNAATLARTAKESGMLGVVPDFEDYDHVWQYILLGNDPEYGECRRLARRRGREVFSAVFGTYPDCTLLLWHFLNNWYREFFAVAADFSQHIHDRQDLRPCFVDGIMDALPPEAKLVIAEERYHYSAEKRDFYKAYADERREDPGMLSPENAMKFRLQASLGFDLYLDAYCDDLSKSRYYLGPDSKGSHFGRLAADLAQATRASDEYVWFWGQSRNYADWKNPLPGRKRWPFGRETWERKFPGFSDLLRSLKEPDAYARQMLDRMRKSGRANMFANGGFERPGGVSFWQDHRYGDGTNGWDAAVGEHGAAPSACVIGAHGTLYANFENVKHGQRYLVRVASKSEGDSTTYCSVNWRVAGVWAKIPYCHVPRVGESPDGWREHLAVVTVPEGVDSMAVMLGCKLRKRQRAWFDNLEVYSLQPTCRIQDEIDAASASGGGTVRVGAGVHETPALLLRTGVTLHLEKGAVLMAGKSGSEYATTGGDAFILAESAENVAITGEGTIDGRGREFDADSLDVLKQPRLVWFRNCRNVRVEGVTLRNGRRWTCFFERCNGVVARKVRIRSTWLRCCDGIDLECSNALVEDCDIESQDDAICIKARIPESVVENVEIRNCRVASNCAQLKIGSETFGTVRNVRIRGIRCTVASEARFSVDPLDEANFKRRFGFPAPPYAYAGISFQMLDGGILEDVSVDDVDLGATSLVPVLMRLSRRRARTIPGKTAFRNVRIENVRGEALSWIGSSVIGSGGLRPMGIVFKNVDIAVRSGGTPRGSLAEIDSLDGLIIRHDDVMPASGLYLRHVDNVVLDNVCLRRKDGGTRSLFLAEDCKNVDSSSLRLVN